MTGRDERDDGGMDAAFDSLWDRLATPTDDELQRMTDAARTEPRLIPTRGSERRPRRLGRAMTVVGIALLIGSGLGFGLAKSVTASGTAATTAVGLGFLPAPGWAVLQTGSEATSERPALAIATNAAFAPDDASRGIRNSSGLPYSTLLHLDPREVLVVARFTLRDPGTRPNVLYPARTLPLRLRDASPDPLSQAQVRTQRPLGQYVLRASVKSYLVVLEIYFGTRRPSQALIEAAQRQIDRLVIGSRDPSGSVLSRALPLEQATTEATQAGRALDRARVSTEPAANTQSRIVDRTFACNPFYGEADLVVSPRGSPEVQGARFVSAGYARLSSGSFIDPLTDLVAVAHPGLRTAGARFPAAVYANIKRCRQLRKPIALSRAGLPGPPAAFISEAECFVEAKVLVRVRAVLARPAPWRSLSGQYRGTYAGVGGRIMKAELAVRDQRRGKPLGFVTLNESGKTRLWSSYDCT